jgi:membrane protein implicated in regulation of membrane protease activity
MVCLWIAKDAALFPLTWKAYDWGHPRDINPMLGKQGMAQERLNPCGYIKVQGELWEAELLGKDTIVEKGDMVTIEGIKGLTLLVKSYKTDSDKKL